MNKEKEVDIYSILVQKRDALVKCGDPFAVDFNVKEINILSDLNQLRLLKLTTPFPGDYKVSSDIFDCTHKVLLGNDLYRTLEYCVWKNRVLFPYISKVFQKFEGIGGSRGYRKIFNTDEQL